MEKNVAARSQSSQHNNTNGQHIAKKAGSKSPAGKQHSRKTLGKQTTCQSSSRHLTGQTSGKHHNTNLHKNIQFSNTKQCKKNTFFTEDQTTSHQPADSNLLHGSNLYKQKPAVSTPVGILSNPKQFNKSCISSFAHRPGTSQSAAMESSGFQTTSFQSSINRTNDYIALTRNEHQGTKQSVGCQRFHNQRISFDKSTNLPCLQYGHPSSSNRSGGDQPIIELIDAATETTNQASTSPSVSFPCGINAEQEFDVPQLPQIDKTKINTQRYTAPTVDTSTSMSETNEKMLKPRECLALMPINIREPLETTESDTKMGKVNKCRVELDDNEQSGALVLEIEIVKQENDNFVINVKNSNVKSVDI